jgi:hypothetical protein
MANKEGQSKRGQIVEFPCKAGQKIKYPISSGPDNLKTHKPPPPPLPPPPPAPHCPSPHHRRRHLRPPPTPYLPPANAPTVRTPERRIRRRHEQRARRGDVLRWMDAAVRQLLHQEVRDPRPNPMSVTPSTLSRTLAPASADFCLVDRDWRFFFTVLVVVVPPRREGVLQEGVQRGRRHLGGVWVPYTNCGMPGATCLIDPLVWFSGSVPRGFWIWYMLWNEVVKPSSIRLLASFDDCPWNRVDLCMRG